MTVKTHFELPFISTELGYDIWSRHYDDRHSHTIRASRKALKLLLPDLAGKTVLEVGCGTGANLVLMNGRGVLRAQGVDLSQGMLNQARIKSYDFPVDFIQHDIEKSLPANSSSVDLIVVTLVMEHLAGIESLFHELSRVLVPGGQSLIIEIHPFRAMKGGFARFLNENDGLEYGMPGRAVTLSEIFNAHISSDLCIKKLIEIAEEDDKTPSVIGMLGIKS